MPLSQQLKLEMLEPEKDSCLPQKEEPVTLPVESSSKESTDEVDVSPNEGDKWNSDEESEPKPDQLSVLFAIQSRIEDLNKSVGELEKLISSKTVQDFDVLLAKVTDVQSEIKRLFPENDTKQAEQEKSEHEKLISLLESILAKQEKNDRQLMQSLREGANFQIQVRQGMQQELDELKEKVNGEQFNPILKEIADLYVEYQFLLEDETISDRARKNIALLFEQLEDVLVDYGAEVQRSEIGSVRQARVCKVIEKIPTGQRDKHNTIAASRRPGVVRNRLVLYPEFVDVYVYDSSIEADSGVEEIKESDILTEKQTKIGDTAEAVNDTVNDNLGGNK